MPQNYGGYRLPGQSSPLAYELQDDRYLGDDLMMAPPQEQYAPPGSLPFAQPGTLADVEGETENYYNTYGQLDALAKSMWKKYKVDITAPDYSQPGGGIPFKTYQKLAGNLMTTASRLGNKLKEDTQMRPYIAQGMTTKDAEGQYVGTGLMENVDKTIEFLKGPFYDKASADRANQMRDAEVAKMKMSPNANDPFIQENIRKLEGFSANYQPHPYLFKTPQETAEEKRIAKAKGDAQKHVGVLKRVTAVAKGMLDPRDISIEDRGGKMYGVSKAWENLVLDATTRDGRKIVAPVQEILISEDGTVQVVYGPDTETGEVPPPEQIDNQDSLDLTIRLQQANPRLGNSNATAAAAEILELQDSFKGADFNAIMGDDLEAANTGFEEIKRKVGQEERIRAEKQRVSEILDGGGSITLNTPKGKVVISKAGGLSGFIGGGYKVEGLGTGNNKPTKEKLMELIEGTGYFKQFGAAKEATASQPVKDPGESENAYQLRLNRWKKEQAGK